MNTDAWPDAARRKVIDAAGAASLVRSHDRVYLQGGCAVPQMLVDALIARYEDLEDVDELGGDARVDLHQRGSRAHGAEQEGREQDPDRQRRMQVRVVPSVRDATINRIEPPGTASLT